VDGWIEKIKSNKKIKGKKPFPLQRDPSNIERNAPRKITAKNKKWV
jgi:hypothetical protein